MRKRLLVLLALTGASITAGFGNPLPAFEFNLISLSSDAPLSLGFSFRTNQAVVITALGYFDDDGDGFVVSHEVGLFQKTSVDTGNLLFSTTLGTAEADTTLYGHFRYQTITPIELTPDTWYLLVATSGGPTEEWGYGQTGDIAGLGVSPLILVPARAASYQTGETLEFPTQKYGGYQFYAGPNMLLELANVPEPGSLGLILAGAIVAGLFRFRKLRNQHRE